MLIACDDEQILAKVNRVCLDHAQSFDLRTNVLWVEVLDAKSFLRSLLKAVPGRADQPAVKLTWAPPEASSNQLLRRALGGASLLQVGAALQAADAVADPPAFEVHYQPVIRLTDHGVVGFEGLVRATQDGQPLDAAELIKRAGRGGWLSEFDQLARALAIRDAADWLGTGLLFLNVMAPNGTFEVESITDAVHQAHAAGIVADQIVLEMVESNRYRSIDAAADQVAELRALGVRIALDDVGDGFASLSLVTRFRPDVVKISGSIVAQLPSPEALAVVKAIVALAHPTGAWVVAENIETKAQEQTLLSANVDWGQGHLLGSPAPPRPTPSQ